MRIKYTTQFKKDYKRVKKQNKNINKLKTVIIDPEENKKLDPKYHGHRLSGDWKGHRDCHIEPDWLLIYRIYDANLVLERTGTHSELFK